MQRERRESEIIGATSKTREPRGYPRGNVIGSWARGGPFGVVFWVRRVGERRRRMRRETTGSQSFRIGASVCRHSGPKPPQSATTKPRGAYFTNDRPPHSSPLSQCIRTHVRTGTLTRARARARFHPLGRGNAGEKETPRGRLILVRPAAQVPSEK